jgi:biotin carboxyl carrier protein
MLCDISISGKIYRLDLKQIENRWLCRLEGREILIDNVQSGPDRLSLLVDGKSFEVRRERTHAVFVRGKRYEVSVEDPRSWRSRKRTERGDAGPQKLTASMPGRVVRVLAREGDPILAGQGLVVVEAMKMQNEIKSPRDGVLKKLLTREGVNVNAGEVLAIVE